MSMNIFASISQRVEPLVAKKVAEDMGFQVEQEKRAAEHKPLPRKTQEEAEEAEDAPENLVPRPPVVTFLGHVDHGKTSLMDRIRNTAVAKGEHGGITQHIGAYTVEVSGQGITFLDTPGHAAFTAMRARGANLTDIAVIVVAADDGVMPQTEEAIQHARAAEVPMIVAVNKTDLPTANVERVKMQLQATDLAPEDWGGETICCAVSALTGDGIAHLLEMILLQAEVLELRANPSRRASGYVIEARLEPGMGPTANLLVTNGTLSVGDALVCGSHWGRVRSLINDHGIKVKSAKPSTPVKCLGLSGVPEAGAAFRVCATDRAARSVSEQTAGARVEQKNVVRKASLEDLFEQLKESERLDLKMILKADTQGSVEAITHALQDIKSTKVSLSVILSGTGAITGNDVMLASASNAVIVGFHVPKGLGVDAQARREGVRIYLHTIIYELLDQVRQAMTGLLAPQIEERVLGHAEIRKVFPLGKRGRVAGCLIVDGVVRPSLRVRLKRGGGIVYQGTIESLKHFQEDASELREAQECGIRLDNFLDFAEGDVLEFYEMHSVEQTL
jgi:translation initiation factor IF-2